MAGSKRVRWRMVLWPLLALALVVSLTIGASGRPAPSTPAQRAAALDSELRCPSCDDTSVADSSAASAVAIRQLVLQDFRSGVPESSIVSYLQGRYPGIVLRPPASGLEGIVWFAPIGAFVVAACWVGTVFWRRHTDRTRKPVHVAEDDRRIVAIALEESKGSTISVAQPPRPTSGAQL